MSIIKEIALAINLLNNEGDHHIDPEELVWMTRTVYHEARDQSQEGQVAVAQVVMNRVNSPKYPNTVREVVQQDKQFSWFSDGKTDEPQEWPAYHSAMVTSYMVMAGLLTDQVHGSTHYFAQGIVIPIWAAKMKTVVVIGGHTFKREPYHPTL